MDHETMKARILADLQRARILQAQVSRQVTAVRDADRGEFLAGRWLARQELKRLQDRLDAAQAAVYHTNPAAAAATGDPDLIAIAQATADRLAWGQDDSAGDNVHQPVDPPTGACTCGKPTTGGAAWCSPGCADASGQIGKP